MAALILSIMAVWRLPIALGPLQEDLSIASSGLSIVLAAGLFMLLRYVFTYNDIRLKRIAYVIGLIFSGFTVIGKSLSINSSLGQLSWDLVLDGIFLIALYTIIYGAGLFLIYQGAEFIINREPSGNAESLFSKITGNGFFVFAFLIVCWLPVWLAFYPGAFAFDANTQFYQYMDWVLDTQHPLLHTLLLGACMMYGIDHNIDGYATEGLAIYSVVQIVLLAAMLAYACHWLRRRSAPLWSRICVTLLFALFPFYSIWSFSATKDVLFSGLVLLVVLQLIDIWHDGFAAFRSPLRIITFVVTTVLMMLMRNNGLYALIVLIPFALLWGKGMRIRLTTILAASIALYFVANSALVWATEATSPCKIEFLSIPLQQIGRTLRDHPEAIELDDDHILDVLYDQNLGEVYTPAIADPVKWAAHYDMVDESIPALLSLWAKMGIQHLDSYLEAFLVQNLPYYLPGAEMLYRFDLRILQIDMYPIEESSYFPKAKALYQQYDETLTFLGLPFVRLLSDTAFQVWLCIGAFGLAIYRKQKQWMVGLSFLLGIWITCLIGPVAIIRYMLGFFYAMPVIIAAMLAPRDSTKALS
ncbi:MAG: hypothetical protein GX096_07605 [Clostridiales bacterium]|nr:hypothetical protein [Clostridiales bacterium]